MFPYIQSPVIHLIPFIVSLVTPLIHSRTHLIDDLISSTMTQLIPVIPVILIPIPIHTN